MPGIPKYSDFSVESDKNGKKKNTECVLKHNYEYIYMDESRYHHTIVTFYRMVML